MSVSVFKYQYTEKNSETVYTDNEYRLPKKVPIT